MKSFQLRQSRLCFPLYHPGRLYAFSPSARVSSLTFRAAPKLHLICTIPINRFQISCGYYEHEHGGQGSVAVAPVCTQTYKLLVSVHLSFDNKNTSLKLSSEHKTKRKGNGIMLHVLWKAWLIQTIITLIYFSLMKNTSHRISTWGNKQPRESSCVEVSAVCLCISSCQIMVSRVLGFCYYHRTNLLESSIYRNIKAQMTCMFYLSSCKICNLRLSTCVIP